MNPAGRAKATGQINAWGPDPWDPLECKRYIVEELGNAEQFPARNPYSPCFITLLKRLDERYGEDYITSAARVLRNFLEDPEEGSPEEQALWQKWRVAQADRVPSKRRLLVQAKKSVESWSDGGDDQNWHDPNKLDLRTRVKGVITKIKFRIWFKIWEEKRETLSCHRTISSNGGSAFQYLDMNRIHL
ncbi:MAG: hypothetical protein Q9185_000347 [Variospora sp. 1 TL-2023]